MLEMEIAARREDEVEIERIKERFADYGQVMEQNVAEIFDWLERKFQKMFRDQGWVYFQLR